eukprot:8240893-Lingulodinium_polyedra.AAC.1
MQIERTRARFGPFGASPSSGPAPGRNATASPRRNKGHSPGVAEPRPGLRPPARRGLFAARRLGTGSDKGNAPREPSSAYVHT